MQDTSSIKEKIIIFLQRKGPSLPVHIAKEIDQSILFTSAFLSELFSEKRLKTTNLRVGSSPIYFLSGQESQLGKYSQYLKNKEKEAFNLLQEKKFLKDDEQLPAIRVALRVIKDFAIAFKKDEKIYWRYFAASESEFKDYMKPKIIPQQITSKKDLPPIISPTNNLTKPIINQPSTSEATLDIFNKEPTIKKTKKTQKIIAKKKIPQKANEKFFNKIKEYLSEKSIEILDIEGFSKTDITLKVKEHGEEKLLVAYNKKRLTEKDIIDAYKKAEEMKLKYLILSLGETSKKLNNFIEAIRNLENMGKIE